MNNQKENLLHNSEFGHFFTYCLNVKVKTIEKEITKFLNIVVITNIMGASNNDIYNNKLTRKEMRIESVLRHIARKKPDFLTDFVKNYSLENPNYILELDPNLVARQIAQSFFDCYEAKTINKKDLRIRRNKYRQPERELLLLINPREKRELDKQKNKGNKLKFFLNKIQSLDNSINIRQIECLKKIVDTEVQKGETKEKYEQRVKRLLRKAEHYIDVIFIKGSSYPFRKNFIKAMTSFVYAYNVEERKISKLDEYFKDTLNKELLNEYGKESESEKKKNYGYKIPNNATATTVKVNTDLINEKKELLSRFEQGEIIKFDRPFSNNIQAKKVSLINSFFDERFNFHVEKIKNEDELVKIVIDLCEKADEIVDEMFKKVLFDAHNSKKIIGHDNEQNEILSILYSLYPPQEELVFYNETKESFEKAFAELENDKKDIVYKEICKEKQKRHMTISEIIPSSDTIINNLVTREIKFIDSHAVEEFKFKALNNDRYLNYDLEIVARDISVDELARMYNKLKRNIIYTNFVEEIKPGDDREKKYREAGLIQTKTLAVAQEMIAKTILSKSYEIECESMNYDEYQQALDNIYINVLHEERMMRLHDEFIGEEENLERNYQEKKQEWDEQSAFVKALYLIVNEKDN